MAGEWREHTLGELTENFDGVRVPVKEADRRKGPYPYYGASGIVDYVDAFLFDGEYLLIAEDGENLRTRATPVAFLARGRFWVNNHAHIVRGNREADTRFLMYSLAATDISGYLTGSTMPKLTQGNMNRIPLLTPALPEQRAIAHILGTLDDKIELIRLMNETLEAMARALFKSWFVDFDPVLARSEGRDPGCRMETANLFPDRLEDSELGQIPVGWEVGSLLRQARLLSGGTPKTGRRDYWNGDIPWASAKDISQARDAFVVATERSITRKGLEESSTQLIPALSSVVVARGATTGRLAMLGREMAMNQTCYALTTSIHCPFALYCQLTYAIGGLVHAAHGSVFDTVTTATFEASKVVLPPNAALAAFERTVSPFFSRILANIQESRTLAVLRDALLPRLVSGELRVRDAERIAGLAM